MYNLNISAMSFSDLFNQGEHLRNLGHFASLVNLAAVDGETNEEENTLLKRFAEKLDISEEEFAKALEDPSAFPAFPQNTTERRLERLHDLFRIIFADHKVEKEEVFLLKKYAIALGFSSEVSEKIIKKSIRIFNGDINFEEYKCLLNQPD